MYRDDGGERPRLFDKARDEDRAALDALLASGRVFTVHDTILEQLAELVALERPSRTLTASETERLVAEHLGERRAEDYGTWVHYPWSGRLVHLLPRDELRQVRTDRNRYKITREEQRSLATRRIGIIGLSVGNMAALTLAIEGVGGSFVLADFDRLSLSNLNRLRGGVHEIGVKKTVIAARELYELDPYLEVTTFPDGIDEANLDAFMLGDRKLDLLVEECDDLAMKFLVRARAREHRIPVVMDTSDRGLFDIERFDREPDRPLFHGLVEQLDPRDLVGLPTKEKVPYVLAILGGASMSTRMAASLPEVKESISTWPQLASAVALGGAITADAVRRILLGTHTESGRYYVDVESIIGDGRGAHARAETPPAPDTPSPEAVGPRELPAAPTSPSGDSRETIRWLVAHALLAPSPHNNQPWKFVHTGGALECRHDPTHDLPSLDFEGGATWLTFGAAFANIELAARSVGLEPRLALFPDPADASLVCRIRFDRREREPSPLLAEIARRVTNRRRGPRKPLDPSAANAMTRAAADVGARLHLVGDPAGLEALAQLVGACDRITFMNREMHHDVMHGFRWTREEVERHRDGLDMHTMELTRAERAGMSLLREWRIMDALRSVGGGKALETIGVESIASSSAVALVVVPGLSREHFFDAGRAVQRVWLEASAHGVALQPMTGLPYLFARLERGGGRGFSDREARELAELRRRYLAIFDVPPGHGEAFLFRLADAEAPTARSLRRRIEDVLELA